MQQKLATGKMSLKEVVASIADEEEMKALKAQQQQQERQAKLAEREAHNRKKELRHHKLQRGERARRRAEFDAHNQEEARRLKEANAGRMSQAQKVGAAAKQQRTAQKNQERVNMGLRNEIRLENEQRARVIQQQAVARLESTTGSGNGSVCCVVTCILIVVGIIIAVVVFVPLVKSI